MLSQFKWFLSSPVFPDDPDKTAVARIIHVFTLLTAAVIIVIAPFLIIVSGEIAPNLLWSVGSILGLMGTSYLAQKGYIQQASWLVLAVLWFIGLLTFMTAGGVQAPGYVLWLVIILLAGILLGWRVSLGVTILTALAGLLFLWMANQGVLPNSSLPDNNFRVWLFHTVAAVGMVILLWAGFGSIREALTRAQHELQQRQLSEARLAKIFKASPNAQTISELATGIILDVNESFEVLLGYSKEMVLGRSAAELNIYGEKEGRQIWLDMLNEQGFVHELEMPLRHKEGDIRTCLLSIEVIELDGRPCTISFVQDITDRKQAELAVLQTRDDLREREAQLRTILDNLPFWVWLKDVNGHFLMINELFIKENPIYSYKEEIVGKTDLDIAPPELANKYRGDDTWVMENLSSLSVEEPVLTHGEMKTFETYKAPYWGNDNQLLGTFGFARDITERKQAAADREMLIQELERRNAELERFAYTVSHDLKSPLVTIGGFLGFVEKDAAEGDTEQLKKDIDSIWQAANKMRLLLDELLELSRIGRLMNPPEEVPFAEIVTEALVLTQGQTIGCEIDIVSAHEFPSVIGDRLRLVEVVQNLVDNAAKFSRDQPQPRIKIGVRQGNGDPVFFVQDNGIGIPPQYHNDIFDIFNKLNPDLEGTGIGLALVKRIVEVHNGRLWVESEGLGHGSTFCFSLPKVVVKTDAK